jgi:hypothetical protein
MGAKAFEVSKTTALMADLLTEMHIKHRFVFERLPGKPGVESYAAAVEAVSGCAESGWVRFNSLEDLTTWLAQASK